MIGDGGRRWVVVPMECACEDEVVVDAQLIEALRKITLEYQTASLIDDDECKDDPIPFPSASSDTRGIYPRT